MFKKNVYPLISIFIVTLAASTPSYSLTLEELANRLDRLEKQNQTLQQGRGRRSRN